MRIGRDADLEILKLAAGCVACRLETLDTLRRRVQVQRKPVPSFSEACRAAESFFAMPSEDDLGMRFLHRPRHRIDALELYPTAAELRLGHRPQCDHSGEEFLRAST